MRNRAGIFSMIGLTLFLCCGWTAPQACAPQPQPSHTGAEAAGIAIVAGVVIGTIVLVHVHNTHHNLKGCVTATAGGGLTLLNEEDKKTYILDGVTPSLKPGDRFHLHGNKLKKDKSSKDDQTFVVQKISKDYGPCKAFVATP